MVEEKVERSELGLVREEIDSFEIEFVIELDAPLGDNGGEDLNDAATSLASSMRDSGRGEMM
jgi:hypothetical protein